MSPQVLSSLARITTHLKVFSEPSTLDEAFEFCDVLLAQPNCVPILPGRQHWRVFSRLCIEADARGNLVPDAWFAALSIESGCEWITLDRDYARFTGLRWRVPA
jgi:toxin-antitoxin system PIN domain toxin